jgi:hypothetical protein
MLPRIGLPELLILFVIFLVGVVPWWNMLKKSGNPPALSLLIMFPLVNVGLILWFAFAEWPIEREVKALRQQRGL